MMSHMPKRKAVDEMLDPSTPVISEETSPKEETSSTSQSTNLSTEKETSPSPQEAKNKEVKEEKTIDEQIDEVFEKGAEAFQEKKEEAKKEQEVKEEQKEEQKDTDVKKEEEKKEEVKKESKEEPDEEKERELLKKYGLEKFKNINAALEAYKNLESAYGKTQSLLQSYQRGVIPQEVKEGVEGALNIASRLHFTVDPPDPQGYLDSEGNFNIQEYIKDTLEPVLVEFQKSLVLGPMASAVYTIQRNALLDKYQMVKQEEEASKQINEIYKELISTYPILEKDERVASLFEKALRGEAAVKKQPLTKEEILKVAKDLISSLKLEAKKEEPLPIEKQTTGFGNILPDQNQTPKSKEDEIADELVKASLNRKTFF